MKKILNFTPSKVLLLCGMGLLFTLGAFWHHQVNQTQLDRMNVLNQGVGTCFNRITQTFTAMMINEIQSPYLNRGFMGLSDECLGETIKGINPFKREVGKGYETLNKLISEVHWFHEKVTKIHAPLVAGQPLTTPLTSLSERFTKMENFKVSLVDEIEGSNARIRDVQSNNEVMMGAGLLLFVIGLSILSLQEFNRIQLRKEVENEALNLLKAGQANVSALVDNLVDRALTVQGMPVTAQIFKEHNGDTLERESSRYSRPQTNQTEKVEVKKAEVKIVQEPIVKAAPQVIEEVAEVVEEVTGPVIKTSLKEVLVSLQSVLSQEVVQISDVRDVFLAVEYETCEQMMCAALHKLAEKRQDHKKIMISNQIHSDRSIINFFLAGNMFTASELESADSKNFTPDGTDMNMMILREMVSETGAGLFFENKAERNGTITGMTIRLTLKRTPKEKSKLVSVMKGKKKDLSREMMS
ncbi:MAG TPA: hypothetical protein VNJ08_08175 [Bacteriovoracaceae bacterium]|nr:hypothetical protein [Bacteriovoracaceae bacterium]